MTDATPEPGDFVEYELSAAPYRICTDPKILSWRYDEFVRIGFPPEWAEVLKEQADVCLHYAEKLIQRGCSISAAFYILDQRLYE